MGENSPFFPATEAFSITQCNCIVIGSLIRRLIFSSLILAEACSPGKKLAALEEALPPSKRPCSGPAGSPDSQRLALADCRLRAVDEPPPPAPAPVSASLLPPSGASRAFPAVYYRFSEHFSQRFSPLTVLAV
ncbi:hypothetical protein DPX16_21264 [Anabarilius grahami]|uniref:Uncharacterized protein n=1 Tax=Anabarilius grahami TaxID=495550 RepID=A0A3N0XST0_ANAGA|nr:hypothetical protein DPX16_21264 [Anabarilius grahami]